MLSRLALLPEGVTLKRGLILLVLCVLQDGRKFFEDAHIEKMRGTFAENDSYCSKEGQLIEFGERPMETGKKRTLADLCEEVTAGAKSGKRLRDIIGETEHQATFVQYHGGISKLHSMMVDYQLSKVDEDFAPAVIYIHGPPGSGKTRYAKQREPLLYNCPGKFGYQWKDGYSGQEAVLYDNVTPERISDPCQFLQEIDRYFIEVPIKGGHTGWRPKRIYITSVYTPELFASQAKFSLASEFTRRVTEFVDLN